MPASDYISWMTPVFENLKFHRLRKNRTQSQLAKALGLDPSIYSRIEKGERKLSADEAKAAAKYLRISASTLFRDRASRVQAA